MTQMYYEDDEDGIWSLSEIVMNEQKDKELRNDIYAVLFEKDRPTRQYFSEMFVEGLRHGYDLYHVTRTDYMNCCLEEAIAYGKEVDQAMKDYKRVKVK
jgi:hypothetical protein